MANNDERKAAARAYAVLCTLMPSTARDEQIVSDLRKATRLTTAARAQSFSSDAELNRLRDDAVLTLNGVGGSLGTPVLTRDMIDKAKRAVAALRSRLK